jgi:protein ImuA
LGFDLRHVYLLRTRTQQDEIWAITQCLRCRGVGAVIAAPAKLSRIEARRLQLAAEAGGTVGILLRDPKTSIYAAATRWLVEPCRGEPNVVRWKIQLIHGHGGQTQKVVFLEQCRETNTVRAAEKLADRPASPQPQILTA